MKPTDEVVEEVLGGVNQPVINTVVEMIRNGKFVQAILELRDGEEHWITEEMAVQFVYDTATKVEPY